MPAVVLGSEWVPGTPLIVIRRGYRHHGIYAGKGRVIHYAGLFRHRRGRIEEVSLEDFGGNKPIHVGPAPDEVRGRDIVLRARSRLGECRYDLLLSQGGTVTLECARSAFMSDNVPTSDAAFIEKQRRYQWWSPLTSNLMRSHGRSSSASLRQI